MGIDATFQGLLTVPATVERPNVELDGDGAPKTPQFEPTGESVRVRITPARSVSEDGLLGRMEDATHVIYAEPADIRARDRIAARPVRTLLGEDLDAGATELAVESAAGIRDGQTLEIGNEERMVVGVTGENVTVTPALEADHDEGDTVSVVVRHQVLGVKDAAGMGHHLRVVTREVGRE